MCGRFVLNTTSQDLKQAFEILNPDIKSAVLVNFNVAPTNLHPVIIRNPLTNTIEIVIMQWGLIPEWVKDTKSPYNTINARFETLYQRTSFKKSFTSRRCLVPASGFYEWDKKVTPKQPYYISSNDNQIFSFGGL